uniref:Uncharacterized protein n=1 Tax=Lepeophtheirus salmonis TaxID=72036 RepID=A0A0K2TTP7_LEPSM
MWSRTANSLSLVFYYFNDSLYYIGIKTTTYQRFRVSYFEQFKRNKNDFLLSYATMDEK